MADDEDALTWAGDREDRMSGAGASSSSKPKKTAKPTEPATPTVHPSVLGEKPTTGLDRTNIDGLALDDNERPTFDELMEPNPPTQLPGWVLVVYGLFAGVYLLFSVAWLIVTLNPPVEIKDPLGSFMWMMSLWLATFGGVIWFVATFMLARHRSLAWRLVMLAVGAVVLIPWPYIHLAIR